MIANSVIRGEVAVRATRATKGGAHANSGGYMKGIFEVVASVRTKVTGRG